MIVPILLAAAAAAQAPQLPAFMTGCWNLIDGEHWTQECWMEPKAGMMLGASREGAGAKLKSWEHLRIEQSADGKITLFASPRRPLAASVRRPHSVGERRRIHQRPPRFPAAHPLRAQGRQSR